MIPKGVIRPLFVVVLLAIVMALAAGSVGAGVRSERLQECTDPPAKPQLIAPPNNSVVGPAGIVLQWTAVDGATLYRGQLSDASNFPSDRTLEETTTSPSYSLPELNPDICLYWRVQAENDCGVSGYTSSWRFCSPSSSPPTDTPTNTIEPPTITPTPSDTLTPSITPTPSDTPTPSITPTPSDTPTNTLTPTPSNTPTNTFTPTPSNTPTNTYTPSVTPTRTNTPEGRYIFGEVRDINGNTPLSGVVVTLLRNDSGNWTQINQKTTDTNGHYAFGFSPVPVLHRIVETDPSGYASDSVALPSGFDGTVVNANTVEFEPPGEGSVGPLVFYDRRLPTNTPSATPKPSDTPTATATKTATLGASPTATMTSETFRIWLPMVMSAYVK